MNGKAVVLLSGGLDSTTVLYKARFDGYEVSALTVNYGQRHGVEVSAAQKIAADAGVPHYLAYAGLWAWGGSALTDENIRVPEEATDGIPVTYVPARNTVLLSLALSCAEAIGARDIFIGVSQIDYSGYPDCRLEFVDAFERLADVATKAGVEGERWTIHAPLLHMTKAATIRLGRSLGVDYDQTHSCYSGPGACGVCDSCRIRAAAFAEVDA